MLCGRDRGLCCERKDRVETGGGGEACCVAETVVCVVKGRTGWRQEVEEKRVVWQRPWFVL